MACDGGEVIDLRVALPISEDRVAAGVIEVMMARFAERASFSQLVTPARVARCSKCQPWSIPPTLDVAPTPTGISPPLSTEFRYVRLKRT